MNKPEFKIVLGIPDVEYLMNELLRRVKNDDLKGKELSFFKKVMKTLYLLSTNPQHPGLHSHEISILSDKYGTKIFESYIENKTPKAARIFWVYGPEKNYITIVAIEPHPEKCMYGYLKLSMPSKKKN